MIELAYGSFTASVNPLGASLAGLAYDGAALLVSQDGAGTVPQFRGAVLSPWPIRLEDGAYEFEGTSYRLPVNEPDRNTALHGLVYDKVWDVVERSDSAVRLGVGLEAQGGYPFPLELEITYLLGDDGITVTLTATNVGSTRAPYGCGFHPYVLTGADTVDAAVVQVRAATRIALTPDRLLPVGRADVASTAYDLSGGRPLGDLVLDDMFTDVERDAGGVARASAGRVEVWWDAALPYLQTYTPAGRGSLALEPCSCAANAFRSGDGLVILDPGQTHRATFGVSLA